MDIGIRGIRALPASQIARRMTPLLQWLRRPVVRALVWTLGILVAVTVPAATVPTAPPDIGIDKGVHLVMFAGFGWLWMRALQERSLWWRGLVVGGVGLALALGTEALQHVALLTRQGSLYDALANGLGLVLGMGGGAWRSRQGAMQNAPERKS